MKKKAVLLWFVYFSNLIIVPRFFLTQAEDGTLHVDRKVYILVQLITAMYALLCFWLLLFHYSRQIIKPILNRY